MIGDEQRSSVALVLSCTTTGVDPIEAWCMAIQSNEEPLCVSTNIVGSALLCTEAMMSTSDAFSPLLIIAKEESTGVFIELFSLTTSPLRAETLNVNKSVVFSSDDEIYEAPTMAMGPSPPVLCLCWKRHIVVIIRERGLLLSYHYSGESKTLKFSFKHKLGNYVIDGGLQSDETVTGGVKVCALVSEPDKKDGRIVKINL